MMNAAIDHLRPNATGPILINERDGENMHASWSKRAGDFPKSLLGIKDMLEDILRDMKVDRAIAEREPFKVFIPHAIHILLVALFGVKLATDVIGAFAGQSSACASASGGRLVDDRFSPYWKPPFDHKH
jgi:hypothetical protein